MNRSILAAIWAICAAPLLATIATAEKRVALVVGNSDYVTTSVLSNPERDARAIATKLESLGFDVVEGYNLGYEGMRDTVRSFARETRDADLTVFYYAGHGIAIDNVNYVVPIDARMDDAVDWEFEVYALPEILRVIGRSEGASLVFLDACRDNPMAQKLAKVRGMSTRSLSTRGLTPIAFDTLGTTGSVISYATEPGQVAMDGDGVNSPFTIALLRHIGAANTDFAAITSLITRDVLEMTAGEQRPRFDVSLTGPLVLNKVEISAVPATTTKTAVATTGSASLEVEKIMFDTARETGDMADYQAYLDAYPNGAFAVLARNAITRLKPESNALDTNGTTEAAAENSTKSFAQATLNYRSADPLYLTVTPVARAIISSQATEQLLGMNKLQRKAVQLRLNLAGYNVGRPDGIFGRGTRAGVSSWQAQAGYAPNGYLNMAQHQTLVANTEPAFAQYIAANPNALKATTSSSKSSKKTSSKKSSKKNKANNNAAVGAFIGGVAAGILLSK